MRARVLRGDARRPTDLGIPQESVDCIVTSPPYWNLKCYDEGPEDQIGHGQTLDAYLEDMRQVFAECLSLVKPTGVLWVVADTLRFPARTPRESELLPLPTRLAELAQDAGWRFQELVIWRKNKTLPYSGVGKLRNLIEYILLFTKTREFKHRPYRLAERHQPNAEWLAGWPERYHPLGKNPSNIWDIDIPTQGIWAHTERLHFCPLPAELVRRCIDLTSDPGDTVFDPFAGIGSVPAQAEAMGRNGIGVELNPRFIELFESTTRDQFLAAWEQGARQRQLAREDQFAEAALIYRLRALKAGKELMRHLERLAQSRPTDHVASRVQAVIVALESAPEDGIDVLGGKCDPPPTRLLAVVETAASKEHDLSALLAETASSTALRTFGLDLSIELIDTSRIERGFYLLSSGGNAQTLYEFDLSRHGAFTQRPLEERLFPTLPRLLTTLELGPPIYPTTMSPLEQARSEGEKKLLQSLLASGTPLDALARQLRIPRVDLDHLLRRHGLAAASPAFAVPLPDDLFERAEQVQA